MGELLLIVVVLVFAGLAYWLFGDLDRSERLSLMIGPKGPLVFIILSIAQEIAIFHQGVFHKKSFVEAVIWLLLTGFWVRIYFKERAESKRISGIQRQESLT